MEAEAKKKRQLREKMRFQSRNKRKSKDPKKRLLIL